MPSAVTFPKNRLKYVGRSINNWVFEGACLVRILSVTSERNSKQTGLLWGPWMVCLIDAEGRELGQALDTRMKAGHAVRTLFLWLLFFPLRLSLPASSLRGSAAGSLAHSLGHVGPQVQLLGAPYYHFCCCKQADSLHSKSRITGEEDDCPGWGHMSTLDISAVVRGQPYCA